MIRWRIQQEAIESQETYRIDIDDPSWSGSVQEITSAGFTFQHQSLSDTEPFSQNILEGQLSFNVYIDTDSDFMSPTNLNSIIQGEDGEYTATLKILSGGSYDTLWTGGIIPDLTTYTESYQPYQANFIAKDFILTKRQQYVPDETRQELIDIIAEIVQTEVNTNIKSLTSFDAKGSNDDYLSYVEIDDSSLVNFEDPYNNPIYKIEALQWILQSNNLILKQWDNTWYVSQFSAYDGDTGYEYNHSTGNTTSVTIRNPVSDVHVSSLNKVVPAIGFLSGEYKHRTRITNSTTPIPSQFTVADGQSRSFASVFDSDADSHKIQLSSDIEVATETVKTSMFVYVEIAYGDYRYLTEKRWLPNSPEALQWIHIDDIQGEISNRYNRFYLDITNVQTVWQGNFSISTNYLPEGEQEAFFIRFYDATSNDDSHDATYINTLFDINDENANNNSESIKIFGSSPNNYSYVYNMQDVYFGDAVTRYQMSKYVYDNLGTYVDTSSWGYKGGTRDKGFTELLTEDIMQFQSAPKRLLNPTLKIVGTTPYNPNRSALYDSIEWVYAGGTLDGTTGNWTVKWIEGGKVDEGNTVDLTPVFDDDDSLLRKRTSNLTPDSKIPEAFIDRSDAITQNVNTEYFYIQGNQDTTTVIINVSGRDDFVLLGFNVENPSDGQEILVIVNPSAISDQLAILTTESNNEPINVPNGGILRKLTVRSHFRFRRQLINNAYTWNLIYESSLPYVIEPEEPPPLEQVSIPTFSPSPGTYTGDRDLVISCATSGATIKYSTDGSEPTTTYTGAISLTEGNSYFVIAKAIKAAFTDSGLQFGQYTINSGVYDLAPDNPTFDPEGVAFSSSVTVSIQTNGEPGEAQTVYYTTDGTDPDTNSSVYSTALTFSETTTLKAVAKYNAGTLLSGITEATYQKARSVASYKAGWNLVSHPLKYPLSENSMRKIFNNGVNTIYTYQEGVQANLNAVSANLTNDLPAVKCEPGIGYWIKLSQDIGINWSTIALIRYNLLSNDAPVALRDNDIPYTWSGSNGSVALLSFNSFVNGEEYIRLTLSTQLASYSQKIYLDEIVTRNYGATDYELSAKFSVYNAGSATVYLGIEEYDSSKSSTGTTETSVTVTSTPQTITETLTSGTDYYVRPYIRILETSPQSGGLKLYIREASFSADPGLMTSVTQSINEGWNLIGSVQSLSTVTTDGTISIDFYGWNPSQGSGQYEVLTDTTKLLPGKGYYVNFAGGATEYDIDES